LGLLDSFGLSILAVLALVTVVGIPLALALLAALGLIYALGYSASAWILGRSILRVPVARIVAFLVGWAILRVLALIPILGGLCGLWRWCSAWVRWWWPSGGAAQPPQLPRPLPEPPTHKSWRPPEGRHQLRLVSVVSVRSSNDLSWSTTAGPEIPTRVASSWAANATPTNSAIPVRLAHSSNAITPVSGP
jgi:hypothetical protein